MDPGRLRHRITFQKRKAGVDEYGGARQIWEPVAEVWAEVKAASGSERVAAGSMGITLSHTVAVRYRLDLLPEIDSGAMRIVYAKPGGETLLNITSARDLDERREWLIFNCTQGIADG